jgi:hypothetical protein
MFAMMPSSHFETSTSTRRGGTHEQSMGHRGQRRCGGHGRTICALSPACCTGCAAAREVYLRGATPAAHDAARSSSSSRSRALRVSPFYYYWLGLRLHNRDIPTSGGGQFWVEAIPTLPSGQDPQEFSTAGTPPLQLNITGTSTPAPPGLYTATTSNLGPFLKVHIKGQQGATGGTRLYAEMSAVLFCRAS